MLVDRCLMTKNASQWIGISEAWERKGSKFRFPMYISAILLFFATFRIMHLALFQLELLDWASVILSAILMISFAKLSSQKIPIYDVVIRIGQPNYVQSPDGSIVQRLQDIYVRRNPDDKKLQLHSVDEFSHVVFGLIDYPWPGREGVTIEAFALYLAHKNGDAYPIISGSFDKLSCFSLGRRISALTGIPIIQLGKGQPFEREPANDSVDHSVAA